MDYERFVANKDTYGSCTSWAVWEQGVDDTVRFQPDATVAPGFWLNRAVARLNDVGSQDDLDALGWSLDPNVVLVALNFSKRSESVRTATANIAFHAFHEESGGTSDKRLRDACWGTPLWGGYITDLVKFTDGALKPLEDSSSTKVKERLRDDSYRLEQVRGLADELSSLGSYNPLIVTLGKDVHRSLMKASSLKILRNRLGPGTRLVHLTHYSKRNCTSDSYYVDQVRAELKAQSVL